MRLINLLSFAIVTMNVANTTTRSRLPKASVAGNDSRLRLCSWPRHPRTLPSGRPTRLRKPGSDDCSHESGNMGRAGTARSLDPCPHAAQYRHVGAGFHAYSLLAGANGPASSAHLLRSERVDSAATVDPACLHVSQVESKIEDPCSSDRHPRRPTGKRSSNSPAVAQSLRREGGPRGRGSAAQSGRFAFFRCGLQASGSEQENDREDIPERNAFIAGEMAATTPPDAIVAIAGRGREDYARRAGSRLQHTQRVYRDVPQDPGNHTPQIL